MHIWEADHILLFKSSNLVNPKAYSWNAANESRDYAHNNPGKRQQMQKFQEYLWPLGHEHIFHLFIDSVSLWESSLKYRAAFPSRGEVSTQPQPFWRITQMVSACAALHHLKRPPYMLFCDAYPHVVPPSSFHARIGASQSIWAPFIPSDHRSVRLQSEDGYSSHVGGNRIEQ